MPANPTNAPTCSTSQAKAKALDAAKDDDKAKRLTGKMWFMQDKQEESSMVSGWELPGAGCSGVPMLGTFWGAGADTEQH